MEFSTKSLSLEKAKTACVVVGIHETAKLSVSAAALDKASKQHLSAILKRGDMNGKAGSTLLLHHVPNVAAERVLLVGLGKDAELSDKAYREMIRVALRALSQTGAVDATLFLLEIAVKGRAPDAGRHLRQPGPVAPLRDDVRRAPGLQLRR